MPHHRSKHRVPRSEPPATVALRRPPRVRLVAIGEAEVCPTCERRGCPHALGRAPSLEEARALLGGADGTLRCDGKGRWWAYGA